MSRRVHIGTTQPTDHPGESPDEYMTRLLAEPWVPMRRGTLSPAYLRRIAEEGMSVEGIEVWGSPTYECIVRNYPSESEGQGPLSHLSIKRLDRAPIHDWRHLQAIKNDVCGPERQGVEIYPAESKLVDTSNEYHLWVLPDGFELPVGFHEREVMSSEQIEAFNAAERARGYPGKAVQRPWQPGLTTGPGRE